MEIKKVFLPSLRASKWYICIYKEQKGHPSEENQQYISNISSKERFINSVISIGTSYIIS